MPYCELSQVTIYFNRAGSGVPVVLLHQYFGTSENWLALFDLLRRHFDVIAPDLRAHGRSSDPGGRLTLQDFAADVAELLHRLDIREAHVVGASLGAMVAARLALSGAVSARSLVFIGPPNFDAPSTAAYTRSVIEELFPAHEDEYAHAHRALGQDHARKRLLANFIQDGVERPREMREWAQGIELLDRPTLLMAGDNDPVAPADWLVAFTAQLPRGEVCILPRGGHFPHRTLPHLAGQVILDFLLRVERACLTGQEPPG